VLYGDFSRYRRSRYSQSLQDVCDLEVSINSSVTRTKIWVRVQDVADINIYDVLEPCYHSSDSSAKSRSSSRLPMSFRKLGEVEGPRRIRKRMFGRAWPLRLAVTEGRVPTWGELQDDPDVPCTVSD
jgi:hypothetical protein